MATRPTLAATIRVCGTTQRWCRSRRHPHRHPYIVRAPRGRTRGRQWPQRAVAVQLPYPAVGGLFGPLTFAPSLACLARPVHTDKYIHPVARLERAGRDEQAGRARRERTGMTWNPTGQAGGHQSQRPGGSARARRLSESPRVASSYHAFCLEYRPSRSSYLPHPLGRVPRELACRPRSQQQSSATAPASITHQYHSSLARVIARSDRRPAESGTHSAAARRAPHSQPGAGALVRGRHRAVWRIGFICEAICMEGFWACVHRRVGQGACDRRLERSASRPPTADRFDLFDYRSVPFPLGFLCRRGTTFGTREGQSGGKGTGGGRRGAVEWLRPRAALDVPPPHPLRRLVARQADLWVVRALPRHLG